jgi:hypothetical protein
MAVEIFGSYPPEISPVMLSSLARAKPSPWSQSLELEKASFGDDEDFALVISPPPPRWPRVFPSL